MRDKTQHKKYDIDNYEYIRITIGSICALQNHRPVISVGLKILLSLIECFLKCRIKRFRLSGFEISHFLSREQNDNENCKQMP